tara:strand:- start:23 stop:1483 length:1461 start_codon:yes stop_codon:yes gene_type:complete
MIIKIGTKKYKAFDQNKFAKISKDFNPIHCNNIESRKSIFGGEIVHGVNILLTALNFLYKNKKIEKPSQISCDFLKPLFLNQKTDFYLNLKDRNALEILVKSKNLLTSKFTIILKKINIERLNKKNLSAKTINQINKINTNRIIDNKCLINNKNKYYQVNLKNFNLSKSFSNINYKFNTQEIKEILCLSYFVGMVCPGKNSILFKITINMNSSKISKNLNKNKKILFHLLNFSKALNKLTINFSGLIEGEIQCFKYLSPKITHIKDLKKFRLESKYVNNKKALIIGGSRGLGEVTSKYLAIQKCVTYATYNLGLNEIKKFKKEFHRFNYKIFFLKYDIENKKFITINKKKFKKIDYFFYFATPKILNTYLYKFDKILFNKYMNYYYRSFKNLCIELNRIAEKKIKIFYPSTIYINNNNQNFKEYTLAKKNSEFKIKKLEKKLNNIQIKIFRLPEMSTHQNIKILGSDKNNLSLFIPFIKKFIKLND